MIAIAKNRRVLWTASLIIIVLVTIFRFLSLRSEVPETWLRDNAIPLESVVPVEDDSDLAALEELVGDARVVTLGEATHGTAEFQSIKDRMIRYLVQHMGFNVIAFEEPTINTLPVNDIIQTGEGDLPPSMMNMFVWWNTQEVLDLLTWMQTTNQTNDMSLTFTGFDIPQANPDGSVGAVLTYLQEAQSDSLAEVENLYTCFRSGTEVPFVVSYQTRSETEQDACLADLIAVRDLLVAEETDLVHSSSDSEYAVMLQIADGLIDSEPIIRLSPQTIEMIDDDELSELSQLRDDAMAANVMRMLENDPNARVIVWGHNLHTGEFRDINVPFGFTQLPMERSMGAMLVDELGEDNVVTIGFSYGEGSFLAIDLNPESETSNNLATLSTPDLPDTSYETLFANIEGNPAFLLDLSNATPLEGPRPLRTNIGGGFDTSIETGFTVDVSLPQVFDTLIHVHETRPIDVLLELPG